MPTIWTQGVNAPCFSPLAGDTQTDVLVIGGGMAGILCALRLKELGVQYLLVEGNRIGRGITAGTTAVLSAQHGLIYQELLKARGKTLAGRYLNANLRAVERYRALSGRFACDFEDAPSMVYAREDAAPLLRELEALRALGYPAEAVKDPPLPHRVAGAVCFPGMAQFHPLKFLYALANELNICEHTAVQKLSGHRVVTDRGTITARRIIVATHFPSVSLRGLYFMKLYQKRSFVIALENAPHLSCTLEDAAPDGVYLRSYGDYLLVGGGDRRTGDACFALPRSFAARYYPEARERFAWGNQDCVSLDGVPYLGRYSKTLPYVLTATGFNEWGMTTSMVAAELLCDLALERDNPLTELYRPDRSSPSGQLLSNLGHTVLNFVTLRKPRCTHMGCALQYNKAEHSWDCPCHGSRFAEDGSVLDGPAKQSINFEQG